MNQPPFEQILAVNSLLTEEQQLPQLLQKIVEAIQTGLGLDRVRLYLRAGDDMICKAHVGMSDDLLGWRMEVGKSKIVRRLTPESKASIQRREPGQTLPYDGRLDQADVDEWVYLPLVLLNETRGLIVGDNKYSRGALAGLESSPSLALFASQAAVAVHNATLFARIRDKQEELERVLFHAPSGIIVNDADGAIRFANQTALDLLDHDKQELSGRQVTTIFANPEEAIAIGSTLRAENPKTVLPKRECSLLNRFQEEIPVRLTTVLLTGEAEADERYVGFFEDLRSRRIAEESLHAFVASLQSLTTARQAWQQIVDFVTHLTPCAGARFLFPALSGEGFYAVTAASERPLPLNKTVRVAGLTHQIMTSGVKRVIDDISHYPELAHHPFVERGIKAALGLPVRGAEPGERQGVLWLYYRHPRDYGQSEIEILESLLERSVDSVRHITLRERTFLHLEELGRLVDVSRDFLTKEELYALIARQAFKLTELAGREARYALVAQVKENQFLQLSAVYPDVELSAVQQRVTAVNLQLLPDQPELDIIGQAVIDKKPTVAHEMTYSQIAVPIFGGTAVVAVIHVVYAQNEARGDYELWLLSALANRAAAALQLTPLYKREKEYSAALNALAVSGKNLTRSLSLETILPEITEQVWQLTNASGRPAQACYVALKKDNVLRFAACYPPEKLPHLQSAVPEIHLDRATAVQPIGVTGYVARSRQPQLIANVHDEAWQGIYIPYDSESCSCMCVPVLLDNEVHGIITVEHAAVDAFEQLHLEILQQFADYAAIALGKAQEYEEAQILRQVAESLNSLEDRQEVARHILNGALRLTETEVGVLRFWDAERQTFEATSYQLSAATGELTSPETAVAAPDAAALKAIRSKKPRLVQNTAVAPAANQVALDSKRHSYILVPVLHGEGKVIAVMSLSSYYPRHFSAHKQNLLVALASQAGAALRRIAHQEELALLGPHNYVTWWRIARDSWGHTLKSRAWQTGAELDVLRRLAVNERPVNELEEQIEILKNALHEFNHILPLEYTTEPRPIALNQFLGGYVNGLRRRYGYQDLELALERQEGIDEQVRVYVNDLLRVVLDTILDNAARALRQHAAADRRVILTSRLEADTAFIHIRDFGPGIPETLRGQLCRRPVLSHNGSGIGLWQAAKFLQRLNGDIVLGDQTNGCEMVIILPAEGINPHEEDHFMRG